MPQRKLPSRADPVTRPLFDLFRRADVTFTNLETLSNDHPGDPALEGVRLHFGAPA